jgi:predicted O-methyltransferase YrrM
MLGEATAQSCPAIHDVRVQKVLARLHRAARRQRFELAGLAWSILRHELRGRQPSVSDEVERIKHLYVPVSLKQGQLLYQIARTQRAQRVIEFGTSFGVSTTYLAAAVRDNGGGVVIGSELEPGKVAAARRNLDEAGLADLVEIREGNAVETLRDPGGPVDLVFIDSYMPLCLPILQMLTPSLRRGGVVLAANVNTFRWAMKDYIAYVQDPRNGFLSTTLFIGDGIEYALRL